MMSRQATKASSAPMCEGRTEGCRNYVAKKNPFEESALFGCHDWKHNTVIPRGTCQWYPLIVPVAPSSVMAKVMALGTVSRSRSRKQALMI